MDGELCQVQGRGQKDSWTVQQGQGGNSNDPECQTKMISLRVHYAVQTLLGDDRMG